MITTMEGTRLQVVLNVEDMQNCGILGAQIVIQKWLAPPLIIFHRNAILVEAFFSTHIDIFNSQKEHKCPNCGSVDTEELKISV